MEVFDVSGFLEILRQQIKTPFSERNIHVSGVFEPAKREVNYNGFYYAQLRGKGNVSVKLRIPADIYCSLNPGVAYIVEGVVTWQVRNNGMEVVILVKDMGLVDVKRTEQERKRAVEEVKVIRLKRPVNADLLIENILRSGRRPRIVVIVGKSAITDKDVLKALGEYRDYYDLDFYRVNMTSPSEIITAIYMSIETQPDVIAIVRGGGSGLDVFDDISVAGAIVSSEVPVVTALGHEEDTLLADMAASYSYSTPTAFGERLAMLAKESVSELAGAPIVAKEGHRVPYRAFLIGSLVGSVLTMIVLRWLGW